MIARARVARIAHISDNVALADGESGPHTIRVLRNFGHINSQNGAVHIDGYTQPGASVNTLPAGDNAVLLEEYAGGGELPLYAHDSVPDDLARSSSALQQRARDDDSRPEHADVARARKKAKELGLDVPVYGDLDEALGANGLDATVRWDATRAVEVESGDGDRALDRMREAGVTLS